MLRYSIFVGLILFTVCNSVSGQTDSCRIRIVQLKFDKNPPAKAGAVTDSLLALATETDTILLDHTSILQFIVKTEPVCCTYSKHSSTTSHFFRLSGKTASPLTNTPIPLCCGVPVAIYINDKEIYRAMLWNPVSSFSNNSVTAILVQDTLMVSNGLPGVPDTLHGILANTKSLPDCLFKK